MDNQIHVFDKNKFNYITSTARRGLGLGEIANIGNIATSGINQEFDVPDHGKQRVFSFII